MGFLKAILKLCQCDVIMQKIDACCQSEPRLWSYVHTHNFIPYACKCIFIVIYYQFSVLIELW